MYSPININLTKYCAFCKYWWDPTCKYIQPNVKTQWLCDKSGKCRCIVKGLDTYAGATCNNFKSKIDI